VTGRDLVPQQPDPQPGPASTVEATVGLLLTWAIYHATHPGCIVIETWPTPSVPLAITVLNNPR